MRAYLNRISQHLQGVSVTFECGGGTGIHFAEAQLWECRGYDIVMFITGGNNIDDGMSPLQLADRLHHLANDMLSIGPGSPQCVVITSLWPRADRRYNTRAREFAEIMEARLFVDPQVTFWLWDRRMPFRTYDGVHLYRYGYRRASIYLAAAIVWVINHNLW